MTYYARPREGRRARSSSTSAQRWCRKARSQESPGDRRFSKLRQVVTWLEERMKSVGVLSFGMACRVMRRNQRSTQYKTNGSVTSPQDEMQYATIRRRLK